MSTKKNKRNKTGRKRAERKMVEIDIESGEGFYGILESIIGGNKVSVKLHTGEVHEAMIRGRDRNKRWMKKGEILLLNKYFEIEEKITNTHPKAHEAEKYLRKTNGGSGIIFQDYDDEDSEGDYSSDEESDEESKTKKEAFGYQKTKQLLARKEKVKERESERKGGRVFTGEDVLERENVSTIKNSNVMVGDDGEEINIDDI